MAAVSSSLRPKASSALTTASAGVLGREQHGLGREVGLHRPVVVEVVLAEVREDGDVVAVAVEAVLREGVRGDLERHGRCGRRPWRARAPLQLGCLRRRARPAEGADHRRRPAVALEDRPQEVGRRRLAVGARSPRRCAATRPGRSRARTRRAPSRDGRRRHRPRAGRPWPPRLRAGARRRRRPRRRARRPGRSRDRRSASPGRQQCSAPGPLERWS